MNFNLPGPVHGAEKSKAIHFPTSSILHAFSQHALFFMLYPSQFGNLGTCFLASLDALEVIVVPD